MVHRMDRDPTEDELLVAEAARSAFDAYGAFGGDVDKADFDVHVKLQIRLSRWQVENFGVQPTYRQLLGCIEEVGELLEAVEDGNEEAVVDAFGDFQVFSAQLCTAMRLDFGTLARDAFHGTHFTPGSDGFTVWVNLSKALARLAHVTLKNEQNIRGYEDVERARLHTGVYLRRALLQFGALCLTNDIVMEAAYFTTAETVLQRVWKKRDA